MKLVVYEVFVSNVRMVPNPQMRHRVYLFFWHPEAYITPWESADTHESHQIQWTIVLGGFRDDGGVRWGWVSDVSSAWPLCFTQVCYDSRRDSWRVCNVRMPAFRESPVTSTWTEGVQCRMYKTGLLIQVFGRSSTNPPTVFSHHLHNLLRHPHCPIHARQSDSTQMKSS